MKAQTFYRSVRSFQREREREREVDSQTLWKSSQSIYSTFRDSNVMSLKLKVWGMNLQQSALKSVNGLPNEVPVKQTNLRLTISHGKELYSR